MAVSDDGDGAVFGLQASRVGCRAIPVRRGKGGGDEAGRVPRKNKCAGRGVGWIARFSSDLVEDRRNRILGEAVEERAEEKAGGR